MNRKDDFEPYWQDETDWLSTVEFLPTDDPEGSDLRFGHHRVSVGYAHLTNTCSLALVGDPDANAYELLFSFSSSKEKTGFWNWPAQIRTWKQLHRKRFVVAHN